MYCTLNTPKIDMDQVLCGQICPNDIVFVHRKGRRKDVEVRKSEQFLGLTIADNGYGCSYIKKIRTNSTASRVPFIQVSFSDFFLCINFLFDYQRNDCWNQFSRKRYKFCRHPTDL